jgi:hypothetical protein
MSDTRTGGGVGLGGLLAVVFITLKLVHHIDWSWWWVLSPLWIPASIGIAAALFAVTMAFISGRSP